MARRSNGEGSFYQQKDKSWVYQVTYGRKEDGSPYRKAFKGRTKTICKERRAQWEEEQARIKAEEEAQAAESARLEELRAKLGHHIESEILFSEAFLKWLELYKSPPARKPSTYASYLDTYRIHFAEAFENLPLYQITQDTIQDYYQRKQKNGGRLDGRKGGLSAKTIQNQHMLLKDFFAYAMRKYHLPCNPTVDTTRPEVITPEMRVLSPSEMQAFIEEVMRETQRVAILTTLFVGFRVGEVLALKISDLDLEKQTLSVTKNLIRVPTAAVSPENPNIEILNYDPKKKTHLIVQNTPKTSTSNREIAISDGLCELLIRHLFTLATRLVEDKVPLNIVQGILGHSSIETTRKYLHKNEDIEREAIGMMSDYLNMGQMDAAPRLNGAAPRAKFADVVLPTFPQRRKHTA